MPCRSSPDSLCWLDHSLVLRSARLLLLQHCSSLGCRRRQTWTIQVLAQIGVLPENTNPGCMRHQMSGPTAPEDRGRIRVAPVVPCRLLCTKSCPSLIIIIILELQSWKGPYGLLNPGPVKEAQLGNQTPILWFCLNHWAFEQLNKSIQNCVVMDLFRSSLNCKTCCKNVFLPQRHLPPVSIATVALPVGMSEIQWCLNLRT